MCTIEYLRLIAFKNVQSSAFILLRLTLRKNEEDVSREEIMNEFNDQISLSRDQNLIIIILLSTDTMNLYKPTFIVKEFSP